MKIIFIILLIIVIAILIVYDIALIKAVKRLSKADDNLVSFDEWDAVCLENCKLKTENIQLKTKIEELDNAIRELCNSKKNAIGTIYGGSRYIVMKIRKDKEI